MRAWRGWCVGAASALVVLAMATTVRADRREDLTRLIEETRLKVEKTPEGPEREAVRDELECYRHELGSRDSAGNPVEWSVSYEKTLRAKLDEEIRKLEGAGNGAWGLAPLEDDARRGWRVAARALLARSAEEGDPNEQMRYVFAAMVLIHNADVIDELLGQLPKVAEVRKGLKDDDVTTEERRKTLDRGLAGGRSLRDMGKRLMADPKFRMGPGEIGSVRYALMRVQSAADEVRSGEGQAAAAQKADEEYLKQAADVEARAKALASVQNQMSGSLVDYVGQVRLGLGFPQARSQAITLLDNITMATDLAESVEKSRIATPAYRKSLMGRLADAVQRILDRNQRSDAYRDIAALDREDRTRRRWEGLSLSEETRARLFAIYLKTDETARTTQDDEVRRRAENLRGAMGTLAWRLERLYGETPPTMRSLAVAYSKGLRDMEPRLTTVAHAAESDAEDADRQVWAVVGVINDLDLIRSTDGLLTALGRYTTVPTEVRDVCGEAAARLVDADAANDKTARDVLWETRNSFGLLNDFQETALAAGDISEAARISKGKYLTAYRAHLSRLPLVVQRVLEKDYQERNVLADCLPLYRMMSEWMLIEHGAQRGDLDRMQAARSMTAVPERVKTVAASGKDMLADAFAAMLKAKPNELKGITSPVRLREQVVRTALAGLLELRREKQDVSRLDMVIENLWRGSQGDPGNDARERWRAAWEVNEAMEAYERGYPRTGDFHAQRAASRNPLLNVPLVTPEERK